MDNTALIDLIDLYMAKHEIRSYNDYSDMAGLSSGLISKWRNGAAKPGYSSLTKIAEATGIDFDIVKACVEGRITPEQALLYEGSANGPIKDPGSVPVFSADEIFRDIDLSSDSAASGRVMLHELFTPADEFFAVSLTDNNMAPELYSGDIVIVHRQDHASDGDTVIVCTGSDNAICSLIKHTDDGIILHSAAREPAPMFYSSEAIRLRPVVILGKVVDISHRAYK